MPPGPVLVRRRRRRWLRARTPHTCCALLALVATIVQFHMHNHTHASGRTRMERKPRSARHALELAHLHPQCGYKHTNIHTLRAATVHKSTFAPSSCKHYYVCIYCIHSHTCERLTNPKRSTRLSSRTYARINNMHTSIHNMYSSDISQSRSKCRSQCQQRR